MDMHTVVVQYFKRSGKYYSEEMFEVDGSESWPDILTDIRQAHGTKPMPGLSTDGGNFYVHIESPDHPEAYPVLLIPKEPRHDNQ